jgi:hypothetical protein
VDDWKNGDHKFLCKMLSVNAKKVKEKGGTKKTDCMAHLNRIEELGQKVVSDKVLQILTQMTSWTMAW